MRIQLSMQPGNTLGTTKCLLHEASIRGLKPKYIACGAYEINFIHLAKDILKHNGILPIPERVHKSFCLQLLDEDHNILCEVNAQDGESQYVFIMNEKPAQVLCLPLVDG